MRAIIGLILIVLGALALIYHNITYTKHKKVVDLGPVQATTATQKTVPIPTIAGTLTVAAGVALVVVGTRK